MALVLVLVLTAAVSQVRQLPPDLQRCLGVPSRHPSLLLVYPSLVAELRGVPHRRHELHLMGGGFGEGAHKIRSLREKLTAKGLRNKP